MTLHFQIRKEDVLAFTREYHAASPTFRRTRVRVRLMLPVLMTGLWLFSLTSGGFEWSSAVIFLGASALWYCFYPAHFDRRVERYAAKMLEEPSHGKSLGPCELTLSEAGLHSKSNTGESTFYWSAVDRVALTDTYLFIFLAGPIGYPVPVADVGPEAAKAAHDYAISRKAAAV